MADTRMPRGMLSGCQRRVDNLEKSGIVFTLMKAFVAAILAACLMIYARFLKIESDKEWWQMSCENIQATAVLELMLDLLPLEFEFMITEADSREMNLALAKAVIRHLHRVPASVLFWEPYGDTAGTITLNWEAKYQYRVMNCSRQGEGCTCRVVLNRLE